MKKIQVLIPLVVWMVMLPSFRTVHSSVADKGFALVELFTSEGCSSCPAADEAVGRISFPGKNVYVLSFHVDYWNYLGWKDLYSDPSYSSRQQEYGNLFHLGSIYTPQIVVNGKIQFVGSDENRLHDAIESSIREMPASEIQSTVLRPSHGQIPVSCSANASTGTRLNAALVQRSATDFIQRGENKGRTLHHYFIVRDFKSLPLDRSGQMLYLQVPPDISLADCSVIVFLQHSKTGQVLAATRSSIPQ